MHISAMMLTMSHSYPNEIRNISFLTNSLFSTLLHEAVHQNRQVLAGWYIVRYVSGGITLLMFFAHVFI